MSDAWVRKVLASLDENSAAYKAVDAARESGTLIKGVIGIDRNTGALSMVRLASSF